MCSALKPEYDVPNMPDPAGAPRLGGEPLDHHAQVAALDVGVLVDRDPARRARAAEVDAAHGEARCGE